MIWSHLYVLVTLLASYTAGHRHAGRQLLQGGVVSSKSWQTSQALLQSLDESPGDAGQGFYLGHSDASLTTAGMLEFEPYNDTDPVTEAVALTNAAVLPSSPQPMNLTLVPGGSVTFGGFAGTSCLTYNFTANCSDAMIFLQDANALLSATNTQSASILPYSVCGYNNCTTPRTIALNDNTGIYYVNFTGSATASCYGLMSYTVHGPNDPACKGLSTIAPQPDATSSILPITSLARPTIFKTGRVTVSTDIWQVVGSFRNASCLSAALRIAPIQGYETRNITYSLLDQDNFLAAINSSDSSYSYLAQCMASPVSISCGFAVGGLNASAGYHLLAQFPSSFVSFSVFLFAPYISDNCTTAFADAPRPIPVPPPPDHSGLYAGIAIAAVLGTLIILGLILLAAYSIPTYSFRAYKRELEDGVYALIVGARADEQVSETDSSTCSGQGHGSASAAATNQQRFYNVLPFHNRMPRNEFYANETCKVVSGCMSQWSNWSGTRPNSRNPGIFDDQFKTCAAEALAYIILKHETQWASTEQAILQQWHKGRRARRTVAKKIADQLHTEELAEFLLCMDTNELPRDRLRSKGPWQAFRRIFLLALPAHRIRRNGKADASDDGVSQSDLFDSTRKAEPCESVVVDRAAPADPATAMSIVLRELQLDDWEIKPSELEIMINADGSRCCLGQGAFGQVFKAKWNSVQLVAAKQLRESGNQRAKLDFLREVAILKRLRAENIVRFLGVCVQDSSTLLVTEFMAGGDLQHALANPKTRADLKWYNMGRRIALDIARGLAFLHSQNIVHFDLKSPNILLARDYTAKVADVGLAKFMKGDHFTQISTLGTLAWAAPELIRGELAAIGLQVDVYSFGVVLWEIVTAETPSFGRAWHRPPRVPEECPEWVAQLILDCMNPDFAARPTSKEIYMLLTANQDNFESEVVHSRQAPELDRPSVTSVYYSIPSPSS